MIAIYKRELKSYFQNVLACLFICLNMLFLGLYFYYCNIYSASPYISYTLSATMLILVICIPVLTMRSMAEDRKQKTDQLLFTAPVSVAKIVLDKFFAVVTVFAVPTLVACTYPLILSAFGTIPMAESYTSILGYFLMGVTCIAICIFISSITESQIIAAVLGIGALLLGYLMPSICSLISSEGNLITKALSIYDLATPAQNMFNKELDLTTIVYYISMTALFLFFTCQVTHKRRWSISKRTIKVGVFSSAYIIIAIVITVAVNLIVTTLPDQYTTFDVSYEQLYTLSDETKNTIKSLDEDVTIYVLSSEENENVIVKNMLDNYEALSDRISVEYVNPTVKPNFYLQYTETEPAQGSIIVVCQDKSTVIDYDNLFYVSTSSENYYYYMYGYYSIEDVASGFDGEGQITSSINYVVSDDTAVVYQITGHDEMSLPDGFKSALKKQNMTLEDLNLNDYETVPEDAECVFLLGPVSDLSDDDTSKVMNYLDNGGKMIIASNEYYASQTADDLSNFESILSSYGVKQVNGLVGDEDNYSLSYQSYYYLYPEIGSTSYTDGLSNYVFAPLVQAFTYEETDGVNVTTMLTTSENAFVADIYSGDILDDGTFDLAYYITKDVASEDEDSVTTEIALFGTPYIFDDTADSEVSGTNVKLFTNIITDFVNTELTTTVDVKYYEISNLVIDSAAGIEISIIVAIVIPILVLLAGIIVWIVRRRTRK
ncbi:MAG: Gldg family protein [Eubacterium sp.]